MLEKEGHITRAWGVAMETSACSTLSRARARQQEREGLKEWERRTSEIEGVKGRLREKKDERQRWYY